MFVQRFFPALLDIHQVQVILGEIRPVEVESAVHKDLGGRIETVDQIVPPLVVGEDIPGEPCGPKRVHRLSRILLGIKVRLEDGQVGRVKEIKT